MTKFGITKTELTEDEMKKVMEECLTMITFRWKDKFNCISLNSEGIVFFLMDEMEIAI